MSRANMTPGNFGDPTPSSDDAVRQLNSLLRGEISAVETYRMAIDKVADSDQIAMDNVSILREIESEHSEAAQQLRQRIQQLGGHPSDSSGAWGAWAQTVQGTMNLFGDTTALKGLKEGEEHGLKDYEEALDDVDAGSRQLIASELIPRQQRHLGLINQLMNVTGRS
ncbi:MAG: uncharacterized protein JWN40_4764 [Phycisphaerales bacterium]|nr:uncharacterized protein [Phycisphaerales bacterium]